MRMEVSDSVGGGREIVDVSETPEKEGTGID
jgi:hypothetical protein